MIKVGDTIPHTTLMEYSEVEGEGCSIGPNPVDVAKASAGKTIALFALPGAFTPTCSAKHVPGYVEKHSMLIKNGKVVTLNIEGPGEFKVSDADTLLNQAKA